MTIKELEQRVAALETEVRALREQVATGEVPKRSVIDLFGKYKDDPATAEADRLGREWRERENRKSLEELDREEKAEKVRGKKSRVAKPKARKPNVRV